MSDPQNEQLATLLNQLSASKADQRKHAAQELATLGDHRAIEPLIAALSDRSTLVRNTAVWALGQLQALQAFDPILRAIQHERVASTTGLEALRSIHPERAFEPILAQVHVENWNLRWHAVRELAFLGTPRAVPPLIDVFTNDPIAAVREMAAHALGMLHAQGIAMPLYQQANDRDPVARTQLAIERLAELGVTVTHESSYFRVLVPHDLSSPVSIEVGYLMAQLADDTFPHEYAPLTAIPSRVLPYRSNPQIEFRDNYPAYSKYIICSQSAPKPYSNTDPETRFA